MLDTNTGSTSAPSPATGSFDSYYRLVKQTTSYWKVFTLSVIGMIVVAATDTAFAALMKPLMDEGFLEQGSEIARWIPLALIGIFIVRAIAMFMALYGMSWVGRNIILVLRDKMFTTLMSLPKSYYDTSTTGEIIAKFTFDIEQVANAATRAVTILVRDSLTVLGLILWMFYLDVVLASVFFIIGPFIALIITYVSKRFRIISRRIQTSMGGVSRVLEESVKAHIVVKIFGGRDYELEQFNKVNNHNRQQNMKLVATNALSTPIMQALVAIALACIIFIATNKLYGSNISAGAFMSFMIAMVMLFAPIKRLTSVNEVVQKGIAASESVFTLIDLEQEKDTGSLEVKRVDGDVVFSDVSFEYPSAKAPALNDINLTIKSGQTVAFVGRSGSGKSTLLNLIPRLYDITEGSISIDGEESRSYTLANLRAQISYVGQDVVLFNDTITHNIAYGSLNEVTDAEIEKAATSAHATEFIKELKDGFDTIVGERGLMLSGGQRQRIAIARALLKDAPILILDEATSALDTESERFIQSSLEVLMENRTTLVIAHRLSTIENADIIVVLDDGHIVEQGTHNELIDKNGYYANLHNLQFADDPA